MACALGLGFVIPAPFLVFAFGRLILNPVPGVRGPFENWFSQASVCTCLASQTRKAK